MSRVLDLVARLRAGKERLSRNRNFDFFEQPHAKLALRRHHYLQRLERDLLHLGPDGVVTLREESGPGGQTRLVLSWDMPGLRLRRLTYLTKEEVRLLRMVPEVDRVLPRAEDTAREGQGGCELGLATPWAGKRG